MTKIIITENQYKKLFETGSNSAAMDLDIYTQPINFDTDNGNLDEEEAVEEIIDRLRELLYMFKSGKKVSAEEKGQIFQDLDQINKNFEKIKYKN